MTRIIETALKELSTMMYEMGELAHKVISLAISECVTSVENYTEVREISNKLMSMEEAVEDKVVEIIARYQPVASDLRKIKSSMKIAYDFARFGRYALDISFTNRRTGGLGHCEPWIVSYITEMGEKTLAMVKMSLEALKHYTPDFTSKISMWEHELDKMYFDFFDKLTANPPATTECIISSVLIARYLERIGDHTTYLCKSIVYMETGEKILIG